MKVACISASSIPSTTANSMQVMKACQAISQLGHDVYLFLPGQKPDNNIDLASYYGIQAQFPIEWLSSRPGLHRYDFVFHAVRKARALKVDISYVWLLQAGIFSLLAHLPVILELHGPPEGKFGPILFKLFQRLPGKKRILPITRALATQIQARFDFNVSDPMLTRISPNGVDLERYTDLPEPSVARQILGLPPIPTAGYTGHLYPGRGMNLLMGLARSFPQIGFLWVGGQPADISKWRENLNLNNIKNVTITGFVQNIQLPLYQAAADILLMPYEKVITGSSGGNSSTYASPMKMFEYMAARRAIVSSDLPVIQEVLNSTNSWLCPPEDIDSWSQAIGTLILDPNKRIALAQQAWQDVQQYTWLERAKNALAGFAAQ
jgi:glycosyltransferase involved in cell wall biosynthesis